MYSIQQNKNFDYNVKIKIAFRCDTSPLETRVEIQNIVKFL